MGVFEDNVFTAKRTGMATLKASTGAVSQTLPVQVIGRADIESLTLIPSIPNLSEGATIQLSLRVKNKAGVVRTMSAAGFPMEISGFKGEITGDKLHVTSLAGSSMGQIIVHYDGFSSMLTLPIGEKTLWADFGDVNLPLSYDAYPAGVTGSVYNINNEIHLTYDFTLGSGNKASYAVFGDPAKGAVVPGQPQSMSLRLNGDNSLNMFRAEIFDATGKLTRVDIVKSINWKGWQTVEVDLTPYNMTYPISVQHIYVASPALGQDERALTGEIAINKKTILVNGKSKSIDTAPVNFKGTTLVPIRFVTEQLGGTVKWDPKEKKASILHGSQLIDFWVGKKEFIVNGNSATALGAPQMINGRTMVPLRVLSEKLGWKVTWDDKTKSILLQ
jgi:hypothetical protein